jgi:subtilisin family serine protease
LLCHSFPPRRSADRNLSLAGPPNRALADVIRRAQAKGVAVVAAAGNAGPAAPPAYPGAYPKVVAVTAVDGTQKVYRFANRGSYIMFAAQGVDVATPSGGKVSGTSFAAPVVAAMLAAEMPRQDAAAADRAIQRLRKQARDLGAPGRDSVYGFGVLKAGR